MIHLFILSFIYLLNVFIYSLIYLIIYSFINSYTERNSSEQIAMTEGV